MPGIQPPSILEEASDPSLRSCIESGSPTRGRIKPLAGKHSPQFDGVSKVQHWREGVGELENAE